jgi:outer membrane biosynthesis protein TonB
MGNTITKNNDTLNWNNLKTDNFSDSLNNKYLSNDSKLLLSKLDINLSNILNNETDSIDNIFSKYQSQSQPVLNEINTTTSLDNKNSHELSETSPFISSEMYNYLVKKNQLDGNNNQKGGALNDNVLTDDSSTSETSESSKSESESESDSDKPKKPESKKPESKKPESKKPEPDSDYLSEEDEPESEEPESKKPESKKPESKKPESKKSKSKKSKSKKSKEYNSKYNSKYNSNSEELSKDSVSNNDNLSYVSSPGNSLNSTDSNSENLSGGSISNNNEYVPPSSVNTSDINMISEAS